MKSILRRKAGMLMMAFRSWRKSSVNRSREPIVSEGSKFLTPLSRLDRQNCSTHYAGARAFDSLRSMIAEFDQTALSNMNRALDANKFAAAETYFRELVHAKSLRLKFTEAQSLLSGIDDNMPIFHISSAILHTAYHKLMETRTESILYASGARLGNLFTTSELHVPTLASSSHGHASVDANESGRILIGMSELGSTYTCYLHSHPGSGPDANYPSQTDFDNQSQLERGGYQTIGAIFSRDGYVRFFTHKLEFHLLITGKEIEHVGTNAYKLLKV